MWQSRAQDFLNLAAQRDVDEEACNKKSLVAPAKVHRRAAFDYCVSLDSLFKMHTGAGLCQFKQPQAPADRAATEALEPPPSGHAAAPAADAPASPALCIDQGSSGFCAFFYLTHVHRLISWPFFDLFHRCWNDANMQEERLA